MFPLGSLFAAFAFLVIASLIAFVSKRVGLPYTALLAFVGALLAPVTIFVPALDFMRDLALTPELLFYVFLPTLIFESAYNINIRRFLDDIWSISLLSVISLLISSFLIAGGMFFLLGWIGFPIPFMVALIFGSLISATDPVAVLALFKEYGAPRRLSLIFEGESLFNDGTAVAFFLIVLGIALNGYHGFTTLGEGLLGFLVMVGGGIVIGLLFGGAFAHAVGWAKSNESVSITLTLVLAHLTFILTDVLSQTLAFGGHSIHLSAIIATTVASMVMGNYGRYKISPRAEEFIEKFWGQLAFIANSLVFVLIGFLFVQVPATTPSFIVPILLSIVIVAASRALSIYPVISGLNLFASVEKQIPLSWQHLLSWGSLRGALAVTMVLLIPDTLTFPGWSYAFTAKEFILAVTVGCVFTTLFLKAPTIGPLMRRMKIDALTPLEALEYEEARALVESAVLTRLDDFSAKGYIDANIYEKLRKEHEVRYNDACRGCADETGELALRALRIHAIGIERHYLKDLYVYGEVSENVVRRIMSKLELQLERVEHGILSGPDFHVSAEHDIFERLFGGIREILRPQTLAAKAAEDYGYYRAQSIIARKVVKELTQTNPDGKSPIFSARALERIIEIYQIFRDGSEKKLQSIAAAHPEIASETNTLLARRGLFKVEEAVLGDLFRKELITPKIYISLRDQFEEEVK